jgi:hypothetical protein
MLDPDCLGLSNFGPPANCCAACEDDADDKSDTDP